MTQLLTVEQAYNLYFREYPDVLSTKQVRKILDISDKTLLNLLHEGHISSIKVGRSYRIPKFFLLQYLGIVSQEKADPIRTFETVS